MTDKNRGGAYKFTNRHFLMKHPFYLKNNLESLEAFDDDENIYKKPEGEGVEPSGYIIQLSGNNAGLKGSKPVDIILVHQGLNFVMKYRELKDIVFKNLGKQYLSSCVPKT